VDVVDSNFYITKSLTELIKMLIFHF